MKALPQKYHSKDFKRTFHVENMNYPLKNTKIYTFTLEYKN